MAFDLNIINNRILSNPSAFILECENQFNEQICQAAEAISNNLNLSPIVLLSGPSGSGKTTTAKKIEAELDRHGVGTHTISMDNYFRTVDPETSPKTSSGEFDFESPDCLDMDLILAHFSKLIKGEEIQIPYFNFTAKERDADRGNELKLKKDEIVIFEGIHAFNDCCTKGNHSAFKLYVCAGSGFEADGRTIFKNAWLRLVRRVIRDRSYRGTEPALTLKMWNNVIQGEEKYIYPNADKTDFFIDSSLPYEVSVMKQFAEPMLRTVLRCGDQFGELNEILPAFSLFAPTDPSFVPGSSILREFIGGGIFE